jgi:hypothetical protein
MMPSDILKLANVDGHVLAEEARTNLLLGARVHISRGPCATIEENGKVLVCGGIWVRWPGSAEAWVRFSLPTGPNVARAVKETLMGWIESENLDYVDANTRSDWEIGKHFLEWMGMKFVCHLPKYGPNGMDKDLYAWVRE